MNVNKLRPYATCMPRASKTMMLKGSGTVLTSLRRFGGVGAVVNRSFSAAAASPLTDITESDIEEFPALKYPGRTCVIRNTVDEERFQWEIDQVTQAEVTGFDTESKVRYRMPNLPPSLIQVSTEDICLLYRLRRQSSRTGLVSTWLSPTLIKILMSENILKVGHGSIGDAIELLKCYHLEVYNMQDTLQLARQSGLQQLSLRALVGMFLHQSLSKEETLSNWENSFLPVELINYAANDAWASLKVYESLVNYMGENDMTVPPPIKRAWSLLKPCDQEAILGEMSAGNQQSENNERSRGGLSHQQHGYSQPHGPYEPYMYGYSQPHSHSQPYGHYQHHGHYQPYGHSGHYQHRGHYQQYGHHQQHSHYQPYGGRSFKFPQSTSYPQQHRVHNFNASTSVHHNAPNSYNRFGFRPSYVREEFVQKTRHMWFGPPRKRFPAKNTVSHVGSTPPAAEKEVELEAEKQEELEKQEED